MEIVTKKPSFYLGMARSWSGFKPTIAIKFEISSAQ